MSTGPHLLAAATLLVAAVVLSPMAASAAAPSVLLPRMEPSPGLELTWSPARAGTRRVAAWNAMIDDRRAYVRLDAAYGAIAEGVGHAPAAPLAVDDPRLARMMGALRCSFAGLAPATRIHFAYAAAGAEGAAWVWSTGVNGPRLHFEGRSTRAELAALVAWTWQREFKRLCEEMVYRWPSPRARRALARLPENYFR